jgi:uncharacterized protein YkwD
MPGRLPVCTQEGVHAVDEAIRFLRHARPFPALALSPGLCSAAADRYREQAGGVVGHHGCDGSDAGSRISRYGVVAQGWAENIAYGQRSARAIVMALLIDDGVRGRDYRRNIFNPMPRIRFNDATPTIGRGAAEAALFRESVERMDRP